LINAKQYTINIFLNDERLKKLEVAELTDILFDIVVNSNTVDVIKFAIMKIYNPLAGKPIRSS